MNKSYVLSTVMLATIFVAACNKPQEPPVTTQQSTSVGAEIDDSVITTQVKSALLADPDVRGFDFTVETRKGVVQLSGYVESQFQTDRANTIARGVTGVKGVESKVSLKVATSIGNKVDDVVITTKVKSALLADAKVKSYDISVVTRKGDVMLSGFVDNQTQVDRALEVSRGVEGVVSVRNEMSIKK